MNAVASKPFVKCYQCGSTKENQPTEMLSVHFPERRREFCSWPCAITFLENNTAWRFDNYFTLRFLGDGGQQIGIFTSK